MDKEEFYKNYTPFGKQMILDIIKDFKEDIPAKLEQLDNAVQNESFDDIISISHNIKGSFGVFYAEKARKQASEMEVSGKNHMGDALKEQFENLKEFVSDLMDDLNQIQQEVEKE